jgi:DNA-binding GntR family transcriptional regulator
MIGGTMTQMTKLKKQSLTEDTFRALRNAIFAGSYLPGQRLVEEEVAEQLGVSRIVVREAFSSLVSDGLATGEPNRGKTVTALSIDDIAELIPLRLLMESLAATWAARRVTPAQAKALKKHMAKFYRGFKSYAAYVEADFEIHKAIWELGGNKQLVMMLERLAGPMIGFASRVYAPLLDDLVAKEREGNEGSHIRIVDAICAKQPAEARHAMQAHILSFWKLWLNKFSGAEPSDPAIAHQISDSVSLVDTLAGIMESNIPFKPSKATSSRK